jgi:hypothetical protein
VALPSGISKNQIHKLGKRIAAQQGPLDPADQSILESSSTTAAPPYRWCMERWRPSRGIWKPPRLRASGRLTPEEHRNQPGEDPAAAQLTDTLPWVSGGTWVSIAAALIALGALYFSWRSTQAASRAAMAAEKPTKIQEQLRIDAAQPYVWADIRPDDAQGILLNVVVGNSGPTVAKKVRVKVDPPLPSIDQLRGRVQIAETILADGIESLPPGRILSWPLGQTFNLMNDGRPQSYKFTVTANGPFGAIPALNYIVDLGNWRESLNRPAGNLHQLTLAVNGLGKAISGLRVNESQ